MVYLYVYVYAHNMCMCMCMVYVYVYAHNMCMCMVYVYVYAHNMRTCTCAYIHKDAYAEKQAERQSLVSQALHPATVPTHVPHSTHTSTVRAGTLPALLQTWRSRCSSSAKYSRSPATFFAVSPWLLRHFARSCITRWRLCCNRASAVSSSRDRRTFLPSRHALASRSSTHGLCMSLAYSFTWLGGARCPFSSWLPLPFRPRRVSHSWRSTPSLFAFACLALCAA